MTARRAGAPPPRRALCTGAPVAAMLPFVAWHIMAKPLHAAAAPGGHAPRSPLLGQRRLAQIVAPRARVRMRVRTVTQPADRWRPRRRRSDPHGEFAGLNCLYEARSVADAAAAAGVPAGEADALLADARERLHARRAARPRPHLDDKARPAALLQPRRPARSVRSARTNDDDQQGALAFVARPVSPRESCRAPGTRCRPPGIGFGVRAFRVEHITLGSPASAGGNATRPSTPCLTCANG